MQGSGATELVLIRHAPALTGGRLCGQTDVPADCSDAEAFNRLSDLVGPVDRIALSPARRCRETVHTLWPGAAATEELSALWEQDFGDWDGRPYADIPDIGPLSGPALAAHRPPSGESFDDLCARVAPALAALCERPGRVAVVGHAGVTRAALALVVGAPAALGFDVAPLSATLMRCNAGQWSVGYVNRTA